MPCNARTLFGSSESEIDLPGGPLNRQLSTFAPTKDNVIGEVADEWTIRLNFEDVCNQSRQLSILNIPDMLCRR